ncbi:MAG: hypothetical protein H6862_04270 [Rhodospirillales bacterium]|nr:hypothetical protein [Rhodospirillales bacterium]
MAAKGKNPVLHAEKEVGAIQDVLRDWVARNPNDPALEKFKNFKADGVWGEQTNELFTRWVVATQQAHNTAHPDTKIKVDGWAGDQTLSALEGDPKAAQALKSLQDVGLNRLQYRTDIHPPKGQEIGAEGAKPAAAEPKTNQAPEKQSGPDEQTAQKPEDGLGERVAIGVASALGLGGLAQGLKVSYDRAVAPRPMATRVETHTPRTITPATPNIKADYAPSARTGAADRPVGATRNAPSAPVEKPIVPAAKPAATIETAPARPMATRVPVTPEPIAAAPAAGKLGAAGKDLGAAANEASLAAKETSFLKGAWNTGGKFVKGLGYASLAITPVEAMASTEGDLGDKTLAAGKSMLTADYALSGAMVLGSAPVAIPAAAALGLKMAWQQGAEDYQAEKAKLAADTAPLVQKQTDIIAAIKDQSSGFSTELAILNDSRPYTTDQAAVERLQDKDFYDKVYAHYDTKAKADAAAGRTEDAQEAQSVLAGLNHFKEAEKQRQDVIYDHKDPVSQSADQNSGGTKQNPLPLVLM